MQNKSNQYFKMQKLLDECACRKSEGILCWKIQIIQGTCGIKILNRYSRSQKQPHIQNNTKESNGRSKKMMNKKMGGSCNTKAETFKFI